MTKDPEEDIAFHLAWEAKLKKELSLVETYSERIAIRRELLEVRKTIRNFFKETE
jgi:hypothetical protein|tara:strand:- start:337 stop:501 length:165 start_codon:yes stop_codon:yes gene_type:complete